MAFVLLALLAVSRAAPAQASFSPGACGAEQSQPALNYCAWRRYRAADAELNRVYRRATVADTGAVLVALRAAQRAWVRFRDAHCNYVAATYEGGSMQPMQQGACLEEVTRARIEQLREALDSQAAWCPPPNESLQPTGGRGASGCARPDAVAYSDAARALVARSWDWASGSPPYVR